MIFEIVSTSVMGGLALKAHLAKKGSGNDSQKLNKIFTLSGLNVKDGKDTLTAELTKKKNHDWGCEYRYRIPLGRSYDDYLSKKSVIESGINARTVKIEIKDLRNIEFNRNFIQSVKGIYKKKLGHRKEVELSYDGVLIVRIYNEPMPIHIPYQEGKEWKVVFGAIREKNKVVFHDFERIPHICLGGATRYGKSNLINNIIISLIRQQPKNVKLHLIDLKGGVELCDYENIQQTQSIAYEPKDALKTLEDAYNLMRDKQTKLRKLGKKKVQDAGITERHFVVIDEVGELNPNEAVGKEDKEIKQQCQNYMSQIARLGAGLGFRLILATQYPTGDVIPRQCKQNSDAKVCFRVQSATASRVVLDETGAEQLPEVVGRAIYQMADKRIIIQTPKIEQEDVQETITPYIKLEPKGEIDLEKSESETGTNSFIIEETGLS